MEPRGNGRVWGSVVLALVTLPLMAADANAAIAEVVTRTVEQRRTPPIPYDTVRFSAAPGEQNDVDVLLDRSSTTIRDASASVEAGRGCEQVDPGTVICRPAGTRDLSGLEVGASDRGDTVIVRDPAAARMFATVDGGAGDDRIDGHDGGVTLQGGDGGDTLIGGIGRDSLDGGPGPDRLSAGPGDDLLGGGLGMDGDEIDGGFGTDTLSYGGRTEPLVVDLADPGPDGAQGEGDALSGIENVSGGAAADVIRGDAGRNVLNGGNADRTPRRGDTLAGRDGQDQLDGGAGGDRLAGGAGDDRLSGDRGRDRYAGGAGDDSLDLDFDAVGSPDRIRCGPGRDRALDPQASDVIPRSCETVDLDFIGVSPVRPPRRDRIGFDILSDSSQRIISRCGYLRLQHRGSTIGTRVFEMPRRGRRRVRVPLNVRGMRLLARRRHPHVQVRYGNYDVCRLGRRRGLNSTGAYTARL